MESLKNDTPPELPEILVLTSVKPATREDGSLYSPDLIDRLEGNEEKDLKGYDWAESRLWEEFVHADDPIEEERLAKKLAKLYLLKESAILAMPDQARDVNDTAYGSKYTLHPSALHARRFTEMSKGIYGELSPEKIEVSAAVTVDVVRDLEMQGRDVDEEFPMLAAVSAHFESNKVDIEEQQIIDPEVATQLRGEFNHRYEEALDYINELPDGEYEPKQLRDIFQEIVDMLSKQDPEWNNWQVVVEPNKGTFSIRSTERTITIGDNKQASDKSNIHTLFAHEIGVHVQRAVNGASVEDPDNLIRIGLPGNLDAEESLGVLFEYIMCGNPPKRPADRYLDIALATGDAGLMLSHQEILQLKTERLKARKIIAGEDVNEIKISKFAKSETDRIYRGGDGRIHEEDHYGTQRFVSAVLVKDIAYFQAFLPLANLIEEWATDGKTATEIIDFLQIGKFDPTNETHLEYVKKWTGKYI